MGDDYHMGIECEYFNVVREAMCAKLLEVCDNFDSLNGYQKCIYILTLEGPAVIHVGLFVHNALSVKRDKPSCTTTEIAAIMN